MLRKKRRLRFPWFLLGFLLLGLLSVGLYGSGVDTGDPVRRARVQTSGETFNFLSWELQAFYKKMETAALKAERFLDEKSQVELVRAYADQVNIVEAHSKELRDASSQPHLADRELAVASAKNQLDESRHKLERLAYLAEPILQNQTESTLRKLGFGTLGQVFPPVLYHVSELPLNLILSAAMTLFDLRSK